MSHIVELDFNLMKHIVEKIREGIYDSPNYHYNADSQKLQLTYPISMKDFAFPSWMGEAPRANAPWTQEEECLVMQWYEHHKYTIKRLAEITGRNESGVISRLEKHFPELKKVREDARLRKELEKELETLLNKAEIAVAKLRAM